jgi:hypothetical protein
MSVAAKIFLYGGAACGWILMALVLCFLVFVGRMRVIEADDE